jgi:PmbA protein
MDRVLEGLLDRARKENVAGIELLYLQDRGLKIRIFEGKVDTFKVTRGCGLGIRLVRDGRCGLAYTEKIDPASLQGTLMLAIANSQINPVDHCHQIMKSRNDSIPEMVLVDDRIEKRGVEDKIGLAMAMEQIARDFDTRVINVPFATYFEGWKEVKLLNSAGFQGTYRKNGWGVVIEVMAKEGDEIKCPYKYGYAGNLEDLDPKDLARKAAEEAGQRLGAIEPKSGNYKVIFMNEVARELLATFAGAFSAKNVQKGLSLLAGKLGEAIAAPGIMFLDDALLEKGFASRPFDDEGAVSCTTELITAGVLKSFLHNSYTASKAGVNSTGNGSRPSIKAALEVAPSNLYLKPGRASFQDLMGLAHNGILIVELDGLHSGANPVSGDFSLGAQGYFFEQGKVRYPLHNFTVAGNFFQLLKDITDLGNDMEFSPPSAGSSIGSPSILVSSLSISGK